MTEDKTLAARFFFKNCAVSIHLPGEMRISHTLKPGPDDVVLDRDFTPANSQSEFIGGQSDFYRFLDASSSTNASIIKKTAAIGYMLCNKLPRGGRRCYGFLCVNAEEGEFATGKTLFAQAISQFCNTFWIQGSWLEELPSAYLDDDTGLLVVDGLLPGPSELAYLYELCTYDWAMIPKCRPAKVIPIQSAPYVLVTYQVSASQLPSDGSFRRRFVALDFTASSLDGTDLRKSLGRSMFTDWGQYQGHLFDNFMLYCVCEYLKDYSRGNDVFSFYE